MKLREYATTQQHGCKTCALPRALRREVNAGLAAGMLNKVVSRWLRVDHNIRIDESSIRRHRENHLTARGSR